MKLLLVGSNEVWSLEKHYIKYISEEGHEVKICPVQSIFLKYYQKSLINKVLFKAGLSTIERKIEQHLKDTINEWIPDVIWVFKGMEVSPGLLKWAKEKGIKLVNYNPDNPFLFSGSGSGNKNVKDSLSLYDLHFSYDRGISKRIEQEYGIQCKILPFGFELSDKLYYECCKEKEILNVCFLGNPDKARAAFIMELADAVAIDVYGNDWEKFVQHVNISVFPPVYDSDFWKTLRRYRAQLNLMRPHNPDSHNMRSFEVPGVGGIGLFPYTIDHAQYFENRKEVFLYKDLNECISQCKLLLSMSDEEAFGVRAAARLKSIQTGYSYRNRAVLALQEIKKLML
jgi:spore maturation protein CgeB